MAIVTVSDINRIFTDTVASYMSKGYMISQFTHGGSYTGTEGHIDMVKPNDSSHLIRIWMTSESELTDDKCYRRVDTIGIRVSKYTKENGLHDVKCSQTLWSDTGEVLSEQKFYQICYRSRRSHVKTYVDNLDEALKVFEMQWDRYNRRYVNKSDCRTFAINKLRPNFIDGIMRRINAIRGFKRATASCLKEVTLGHRYNGKPMATVKYSYNDKSGTITIG